MPNHRLIKQYVVQQWAVEVKLEGSLYEDAPKHNSIEELEEFAHDQDAWSRRVSAIAA